MLVLLPEVGFEPTHPKIIELKSTALDRSAIQAIHYMLLLLLCSSITTAVGFEPTRAEPNRFRIYRLNHSAMLPLHLCAICLIAYAAYIKCNTQKVHECIECLKCKIIAVQYSTKEMCLRATHLVM